MKEVNKFQLIRAKAEVLENIYNNYLEYELKNVSTQYNRTGKQIQTKHWDSTSKEYILEWEDDEQTIPVMEDEWDYVPYTEAELENLPDVRAKIMAIKEIMKLLEKML